MKQIIAGNWKMNCTQIESQKLINELLENKFTDETDIIVCPPFISIETVGELIKKSTIKLGAQNVSEHESGAFTGEVSANMLKSYNCAYCIVGHSERRQYFNETNQLVNIKSKKLLSKNIIPIICVGETLTERENGLVEKIISSQITESLLGFTEEEIKKSIIAYEPVWAIGTGKNATPNQANEVHQLIRKTLSNIFSNSIAAQIPILYGGSVKGENAKDLLSQSDINGALVGGAALKSIDFTAIINSAKIS